jgi:hypothetical protein
MIETRGASPDSRDTDDAQPVFSLRPMTPTTEITLVDGTRHRVEGGVRDVERSILDAARGSIMELTWLTEAESGEQIGVNPESVMMLRAISS